MKCTNCGKWYFRKPMFCSKCGASFMEGSEISQEDNSKVETVSVEYTKPIFVTPADIFELNGSVCILGVAADHLKIGDKFMFNSKVYTIDAIRQSNGIVSEAQFGQNCVLIINGVDFVQFKSELVQACVENSKTNQPFAFEKTPTTSYIYFYGKE